MPLVDTVPIFHKCKWNQAGLCGALPVQKTYVLCFLFNEVVLTQGNSKNLPPM